MKLRLRFGLVAAVVIVTFHLFTSAPVYAGYRGGEITWKCGTPAQGTFIFTMKLYRDCAGPGTFSDTLWIRSNAPGFDSIGMVRTAIHDITPVCDCPAGAALSCATATQTGSGALEEHIYTSNAFFPNGVPLTGVPPYSGYYFAFEGCCRAPTANLAATNNSFAIRSIMYPYNNVNISNCFDQSTLFYERSPIVTCSGSSNWYIHKHMDPELDSVGWEWARPLQNISTPVTAYQSGYGYINPLPGLVHDSANIPATLNMVNGDLAFTSHTTGSFTVVIKVTAYKCGIKVAEIFREMPVIIVPCALNNAPVISLNGQTATLTVDTVISHKLATYTITATDTDTCQGSSPAGLQTVKLSTFGMQYASPMAPNSGSWTCNNPPCALLSPVIHHDSMLTGSPSVQTTLTWQTGCQHLATNDGCGSTTNKYDFIFTATDNFCPVPAKRTMRFRVVVIPKPLLLSTPIVCADVDTNGVVFLYWDQTEDSLWVFNGYHLFTSTQPNGPFTKLDSVFDIKQTLYIHQAANAQQHPVYYLQSIRSGCADVMYGLPFDTVSTIFTEVTGYDTTQSVAHLAWNPLRANPLPGPLPVYTIFREYPAGSWNVIATTTAHTWSDTLPPGNKVVRYKVSTSDTVLTNVGPVACQSSSNITKLLVSIGLETNNQTGFELDQNIPNPADKSTTIPFHLPAAGEVLLVVHDINGKAVLRQNYKAATGENRIDLDLTGYSAGIYSYSIHYQGNIRKKVMMVE